MGSLRETKLLWEFKRGGDHRKLFLGVIFQMGLEEVIELQKIRKKQTNPKPNKKANNKKGKAFQVPVIARAEP